MKIIDWLLKKSTHHKSLVIDHKEHKKKTKDSFKRVKRDNILIAQKLKHHEDKINKLQEQISNLSDSEPMKVYRRKR